MDAARSGPGWRFCFCKIVKDHSPSTKGNVAALVDSMPADLLTPLAVYLKLAKGSNFSFLLESVEGGEQLARYSFIGADPELVVSGGDRAVRIRRDSHTETKPVGVFDFLRDHFEKYQQPAVAGPPFTGGAIGYMGFRCAEWFEPSIAGAVDDTVGPDAEFMLFRSIIAFDHVKQTISIVTLIFSDQTDSPAQLDWATAEARERNLRIRTLLESGEIEIPHAAGSADPGLVTSNWSKGDFEAAVGRVKDLILAGECYQVVLSQRFSKPTTADAVSIYRAIRSINPSPYMFLLRLDKKSIVGASPEMLVRCVARDLEYRPIAGTRARGDSPDEDHALAEEMRSDSKEVAEHLMLVDLGRNDLGRVSEYGSVKVNELMTVERYSHVQHLVSKINSRLKPDVDRFDALAACFPAGTVSGAPKVRAMEIIKELEPTSRGTYSGAVGYFDYSGNMDTCIAIRTLVLENGVASIQAGAGIVADSVPELEYFETVNKAAAMLKAVERAETL